jgi:enamine deaminase RidA (YjgF/YER057c/UK114 family)
MDNIVEMTMYYVDMERDMEKVTPIWRKYISSFPMVAAIGTTGLMPMDPPLLVEITCSAIIPD